MRPTGLGAQATNFLCLKMIVRSIVQASPAAEMYDPDVELGILPAVSISTSHFKGQGEALPCPNYYAVAGCSNRQGLSEQRRHTLRGAAAPATRRPSRWPRWMHLVPRHVGREGKEEEGAGDPCRGWRGRGAMGVADRGSDVTGGRGPRGRGRERFFFLRYGEKRWEIVVLFLSFFYLTPPLRIPIGPR